MIGAFRLRVENGKVAELRVAYGGMAATTARAKHVEATVTGKPGLRIRSKTSTRC